MAEEKDDGSIEDESTESEQLISNQNGSSDHSNGTISGKGRGRSVGFATQ